MKMLGGRDANQGERSAPAQRQAAPQRQQAPAAAPSGFDDMDDDIPF
jgi:single-stranded DNA-binding protein